MRASSAIVLGICVVAAGAPGATQSAPLRVAFHHIHVNARDPEHLIGYYVKLFDAATTRPAAIGAGQKEVRGIESDGVYLLINPVREDPPEAGGPGWHFGWGTVSLDEGYDQHRMHEIDLKLPMPSLAKDLHVHLESEDPIRAAEWYRDRFAAAITTRQSNADVRPPNPLHRRPAAIVELPGIVFAVYQAGGALASSGGRRLDHIALRTDLGEARASNFTILEPSGRLGHFETMTIEGPDRLSIELVGAPVLRRPSRADR